MGNSGLILKLPHFIDCSFITEHSWIKIILFPYSILTLTSDFSVPWYSLKWVLFFYYVHNTIANHLYISVCLFVFSISSCCDESAKKKKKKALVWKEQLSNQICIFNQRDELNICSINLILERELYMYTHKNDWKEAELRGS